MPFLESPDVLGVMRLPRTIPPLLAGEWARNDISHQYDLRRHCEESRPPRRTGRRSNLVFPRICRPPSFFEQASKPQAGWRDREREQP